MFKKCVKTLVTNIPFHSYSTEAVFKTHPFRLHRLPEGPAAEVTLTKNDALVLYERMQTIRKMENVINQLYKAKIVRGFCHLYNGQEAIAVGVHASMLPQDSVITSYRNHAWSYFFHDESPDSVIAELVGVQSGSEKGKGGSMHMYAKNYYGGNGIVGAQVPMGVGIAFSHKYRKSDAVSVTMYGDGASNNGQVYEAFNMAKLWEVPCLFLCENNLYSMGTSIPRSTPNPDFFVKGDFIPGVQGDGQDVLSMREAARFSFAHIRAGKGPIVCEARTYRYFGHSLSDPGTSYRTRDEIVEVRAKKDPITIFQKKILEAKLVSEDELTAIDKKIKTNLDESTKKATQDKPIGTHELTYDIYANEVIKEVRGVNPWTNWPHKSTGQAFNPK